MTSIRLDDGSQIFDCDLTERAGSDRGAEKARTRRVELRTAADLTGSAGYCRTCSAWVERFLRRIIKRYLAAI